MQCIRHYLLVGSWWRGVIIQKDTRSGTTGSFVTEDIRQMGLFRGQPGYLGQSSSSHPTKSLASRPRFNPTLASTISIKPGNLTFLLVIVFLRETVFSASPLYERRKVILHSSIPEAETKQIAAYLKFLLWIKQFNVWELWLIPSL